jgi:hypothetical protein
MGGKRNKSSQDKIDTSKLSNVIPYHIADREEAEAPQSEPAILPTPEKEETMSTINSVITDIFGDCTLNAVTTMAKENSFYETERYINFKRFYQQHPEALVGLVRKCFESWKASKYGIEIELMNQDNMYIRDSNCFREPRREDECAPLLVQVAYTLYARNEETLKEQLDASKGDNGDGIIELAIHMLQQEEPGPLENHEFSRFWCDVALTA